MSHIIIIGGTGFIGRHLAGALRVAGHTVQALGRRDFDLAQMSVAAMQDRLRAAEIVINAAGLVRDQPGNDRRAVHADGAEHLFHACQQAGVGRVILISALGAGMAGTTAYQTTKGAAEAALAASGLEGCVLRPSVVIGAGGASTASLSALAALPLVPRLGPGTWQVQPIHIDDLCALVVRLIDTPSPWPPRIDVVGPQPMSTDQLTMVLRHWLGLAPSRWLPLPEVVLRVLAFFGTRLSDGPLTGEVLTMLKAGNRGDCAGLSAALGRPPLPLELALARHPAGTAERWQARLMPLRPILRWGLAGLWILTGLLSFGLYPVADSLRLLGELGLVGVGAQVMLYGCSAMDLLLGLLLLRRWRPVLVGAVMLVVMTLYSLLAIGLPAEYWLHPFAPLVKTLPIAIATLVMMVLED